MQKLAIFASGNGSNFEAIAEACACGSIPAQVALLVCDKPGAYVLERARKYGVETFVFNPKDYPSKAAYEKEIADRLDATGVGLVCLAGYMRILSPELLGRYGGRIINIHPSLLPAFKGAHAIREAFESGARVYGVTVHRVDETLDGGAIIAQRGLHYEGRDIAELERMIHELEHELYVDVINGLLEGGVSREGEPDISDNYK